MKYGDGHLKDFIKCYSYRQFMTALEFKHFQYKQLIKLEYLNYFIYLHSWFAAFKSVKCLQMPSVEPLKYQAYNRYIMNDYLYFILPNEKELKQQTCHDILIACHYAYSNYT